MKFFSRLQTSGLVLLSVLVTSVLRDSFTNDTNNEISLAIIAGALVAMAIRYIFETKQ